MKSFLFLIASLVIVTSFQGCNPSSLPEKLPEVQEPPTPTQAVNTVQCANWGCTEKFGLNVDIPGAPQDNQGMVVDMGYYTYLGSTPPYRLSDDCECRVLRYQILFDYLPSASEIYLRDVNGNTIPFSGPFSGSIGHWIVIGKDDISTGPSGGVNIGFDIDLGARPQLKSSGGYCIIENVDAPIIVEDIPMTDPYTLDYFSPETNEPLQSIYMPINSLDFYVP